jgi:hypothetical protein
MIAPGLRSATLLRWVFGETITQVVAATRKSSLSRRWLVSRLWALLREALQSAIFSRSASINSSVISEAYRGLRDPENDLKFWRLENVSNPRAFSREENTRGQPVAAPVAQNRVAGE